MDTHDEGLLGELKERRAELKEMLKEVPSDTRFERVILKIDDEIAKLKEGRQYRSVAEEWKRYFCS